MIRFACPGCGAVYAVDDRVAGKAGQCRKCQARFRVPDAPPPPPAVVADVEVEVAPCPGCGARSAVAEKDLGAEIECPACRTVYPAARADGVTPPTPRVVAMPDADDRPSRRPAFDDDEDDDRPTRRTRRDADDDRPTRRGRRRRDLDRYDDADADGPNGMATASMVLGIIALVVEVPFLFLSVLGVGCCPCFGVIGWAGHGLGFLLSAVGLILGVFAMRSPARQGMAKAGVILNGIALMFALAGVVLGLLGVAFPVFVRPGPGGAGGPGGP